MKKLLLAALVLACAAPALAADVYVKSKTHTDAMAVMGQNVPAKDDVIEMWISGARMANISKDAVVIVDLDKNVFYMVRHADKSYIEAPLPLDMTKLLPPEAAGMAAMLKMTVTVTPTAEKKKIGQWDCTAYDGVMTVMGMKMNMRMWASTQVPFDAGVFNAKMLPAIMQGQGMMDAAALKEFAKVEGFQIATETTGDMMGAKIRTTTEVVEIVSKPAPAGTFAPPAGYTKKTSLSMQDMQRK